VLIFEKVFGKPGLSPTVLEALLRVCCTRSFGRVCARQQKYWFFPEAYRKSARDLQRTDFTMTSIDDLFRKPNAPGKRKLESPSSLDPNELYSKSAKLSNGSSARINGRASTVEDEIDLDDVDAGPALPPEDDVPDDEEGRFFGGGITSEEKEVLDFIDAREGEEAEGAEIIDVAWLRKIALNFEKRVSKNAEMRAKFEGSPERCVRLSRPLRCFDVLRIC
jgi:hypothetical protein